MNRIKRDTCLMNRFIVFVVLFTLCVPLVPAQDIEGILKAPIASMNGGLSLNQIFTLTPDDAARRDAYSLFFSGNVNFNFFGIINVPLSFAYSNQELSGDASLPFNRFSLSPSYKWIKIYAGYASMQFSPYSLAGHELFGGGVELTPNNGYKISAIFGELKRATTGVAIEGNSFRRLGGGFKVEYTEKKFNVGVNVFKAQDIVSSIFDTTGVAPHDNLSGSLNVDIRLINDIRLSAEYGLSAVNRNVSSRDGAFRLFDDNGYVAVYHALKAGITYSSSIGSIGGTYERIDPNYTTLGVYYMTNDYENITANLSTVIEKVNFNLDLGYQRNNLDDQKNSSSKQFIYSGGLSTTFGKKLTLSANLSNIQSYTYINDLYRKATQVHEFQNLDTLNVTQLNYSASLNSSYVLQSTDVRRQNINFNFMYQQSDTQQEFSNFLGNNIYNGALAYQYSAVPAKFNAMTSLNCSYNQMPDNAYIKALTISLSVQKTFFDEMKTSLVCTLSDMTNESGHLSDVLNIRLTASYVVWEKHNLGLNLTFIHVESPARMQLQYSANLAYSYVFSASLIKKNKKLNMNANF